MSTKFTPPPPPPWNLERPGLLARLDAAAERGACLVLVSAPAGYGKTSLLASWLRPGRRGAAWLSLDAEDDDPIRLAQAIERAIGPAGGAREGGAPGAGAPDAGESGLPAEPVARIVDLLVARGDFVLALDDAHLVRSRPALALLAALVERLPARATLALGARSDPAIPLARLRARGRLEEIRAEELRLGGGEAALLAASLGAPALGSEEAPLLEARTEGWAAGIVLAARSLARRAETGGRSAALALLRDARAAHRWAFDFLLEEVLGRLSPELEDWLLRASVLERFTAPLAEAVTGGALPGGSLEALAREALFLAPVDGSADWWRWHSLFSALLLARLRERRPGLEAGLRRRAGAWLEEAGFPDEAAAQYLAAGEAGKAALLLEASAEAMVERGEVEALLKRIDALPPSVLAERPGLGAWRGWCLFFRGRPLAEVLGGLAAPDAEAVDALRLLYRGDVAGASAGAGRLLAGPLSGPARYFASFVHLLALREEGRREEAEALLAGLGRQGSPLIRTGAVAFAANDLFRNGELGGAERLLEEGLAATGTLPAAGRLRILLGEIRLTRGEFAPAEELLLAGIGQLERMGAASSLWGLLVLARLRALRGEEWANLVARARSLAGDFDLTELDDRSVAVQEARILVLRGELRAARRLLDSLPRLPEGESPGFFERHPLKYERLEKARLLCAEGRGEAALTLLEPLRELALSMGRSLMLPEIDAIRALALDALGRRSGAEAALGEALAFSAPEGIVLPFLEAGDRMRELVAASAGRLPEPAASFARGLAGPRPAGAVPEGGGSPAAGAAAIPATGRAPSPRELEILAWLPSELSAAEIGERLYLSENTVKTHLKTLYAKLEAHSRAGALTRAAELGLLPRPGSPSPNHPRRHPIG